MENAEPAKKEKPRYNLFQNSGWMINLAWKNEKGVLGLVLMTALLSVATNLLGLFITPTILAAIQNHVSLSQLVVTIACFTIALMLVYAASAYVSSNTIFGRVFVRGKVMSQITDKTMLTSFPNLEDQDFQKKRDRSSMSVNSNEAATEAIWNSFSGFLNNALAFVIYLLLLTTLNPIIVIFVLLTTIPGFFINNYLYGWGFRHREEEAGYSSHMNYLAERSGDHALAKDIRLFGMKEWLNDVYYQTYNLYKAFVGRRERVYIWVDIVNLLLTLARNGLAYWFLITLALAKGSSLSVAQFLLYFSAVGGFAGWVTGILSNVTDLHRQSLDISTVREYINFPEPFHFEEGKPLEPNNHKAYEIELKNVSFAYPSADKNTLENINLKIRAGEKLAIVGLNGAGKTTLVKLICGLYDPTEGEVLLNGEDIKQYNRRDIYRHFSAVFQDFSGIAATIAENVSQTNEGTDLERVKAVIDKASLTEKIASLPAGLDSHLGREVYEDGVELSGGQMQQLMLARALYKEAPIVLLDEPTAALDPIAESQMYERYNDLTAGRTSVYISHRLASTRFCDRILLISDKKILEEGTHDELLAKNGKYAELFEIQSRYYQEDAAENALESEAQNV